MKMKQLFVLAVALCILHSPRSTAEAQSTAFTYQGQLQNGGDPANGLYDFQFALSNAPSDGSQIGFTVTNLALGVTNGLFATTLDFGTVFSGNAAWLAVSVRSNSMGSYVGLTPLQPLTPVPYAIFASAASNLSGTLPAIQLSGSVGNGQLANNTITINPGTGLSGGGAVALGGATTLNNLGVVSVNGDTDITVSTVNGTVKLGTTATSANTASALVKRDANGNVSVGSVTLGGNLNLPATTTTAGIVYSGNTTLLNSLGKQNLFAGSGAGNLTITGANNTAIGYQALQNVTSGYNNIAIGASAGTNLTTGSNNIYIGNAGEVWDNYTNANNPPAGSIYIGTTQAQTYLQGTVYAHGVALTSDRDAKENFAALDSQAVLAKVAALPLTEWNFKREAPRIRHIGPMAQDFQATFQLNGTDDKHICVVDESGVALAAIQGLNQKLEQQTKEKDAEIEALKQSVAELKKIVEFLAEKK